MISKKYIKILKIIRGKILVCRENHCFKIFHCFGSVLCCPGISFYIYAKVVSNKQKPTGSLKQKSNPLEDIR